MIKIFTTNKNNKIELTKEELKSLLDEAYWEGYRANSSSWTYTTPGWGPYICTNTTSGSSITLTSNNQISNDKTSGTSTSTTIKADTPFIYTTSGYVDTTIN